MYRQLPDEAKTGWQRFRSIPDTPFAPRHARCASARESLPRRLGLLTAAPARLAAHFDAAVCDYYFPMHRHPLCGDWVLAPGGQRSGTRAACANTSFIFHRVAPTAFSWPALHAHTLSAPLLQIVEIVAQYDGAGTPSDNVNCQINSNSVTPVPCNIVMTAPADMAPPIYVYYELHNFYQNHRRYVKSRSDAQLAGAMYTDISSLADCDPLRGVTIDGTMRPLDPCGLVAQSYFNGEERRRVSVCYGRRVP